MIISYGITDGILRVRYLNASGHLSAKDIPVVEEYCYGYVPVSRRTKTSVSLWDGGLGTAKACRPSSLDKFRVMEIIESQADAKEITAAVTALPSPVFVDTVSDGIAVRAVGVSTGEACVIFTTESSAGVQALLQKTDGVKVRHYDTETEMLVATASAFRRLPYLCGFDIARQVESIDQRLSRMQSDIRCDTGIPLLEYSAIVADHENMKTALPSLPDLYSKVMRQTLGTGGRGSELAVLSGRLAALCAVERKTTALRDYIRLYSSLRIPLCFSVSRMASAEILLYHGYSARGLRSFVRGKDAGVPKGDNHGGWNMTPKKGLLKYVGEYDMRSFYPTLVMVGGFSPESPERKRTAVLPGIMNTLRKLRNKLNDNKLYGLASTTKLLTNAICGALSSPLCSYYTTDFGGSLTETGRNLMQELARVVNDYFRTRWGDDREMQALVGVGDARNLSSDVVVYAVTDSLFIDFGSIAESAGYDGSMQVLIRKLNYSLFQPMFRRVLAGVFPDTPQGVLDDEVSFSLRGVHSRIVFISKNHYVSASDTGAVVVKGGRGGTPDALTGMRDELLYLLLHSASDAEIYTKLKMCRRTLSSMSPRQLSANTQIRKYSSSVVSEEAGTFLGEPSPEMRGLAWYNRISGKSTKYPRRMADGVYKCYYALHGKEGGEMFTYPDGEFPLEHAPGADKERYFSEYLLKPVNIVLKALKRNDIAFVA